MKSDFLSSPQVVATVTQSADLIHLFNGGRTMANLLEFRLDSLHGDLHDALISVSDSELPVLATVRDHSEGGSLELAATERLAIYEQFLPKAAIIDVELASLKMAHFANFREQVSSQNVLLLASFHDFQAFPGMDALTDTIAASYDCGADIAKVAVVIEEMDDLFALARLVEHHRSEGRLISAMGMGGLGKLSRLVLAKAGSCLNYGYLQQPNAPGQWSADELAALLREI